jgi:hypothetical protein
MLNSKQLQIHLPTLLLLENGISAPINFSFHSCVNLYYSTTQKKGLNGSLFFPWRFEDWLNDSQSHHDVSSMGFESPQCTKFQ